MEIGNERSRKAFRALAFCPPAKIVVAGPPKTGKWEFVIGEFSAVSSQDLMQVDGSVDGARKAREFVKTLPISCEVRVVLVDGRLGMSDPAQDAYLKICEDTPSSAVVVMVVEDDGLLSPALQSRLDVLRWLPLSDEEMNNFAKSLDIPENNFAVLASRGRPRLLKTMFHNIEELESLYSFVCSVSDGKPDLTTIPRIILNWSDLDENLKEAAISMCEFALRSHSSLGVARFLDTIKSMPSVNVELHWWRACAAQCNVLIR